MSRFRLLVVAVTFAWLLEMFLLPIWRENVVAAPRPALLVISTARSDGIPVPEGRSGASGTDAVRTPAP